MREEKLCKDEQWRQQKNVTDQKIMLYKEGGKKMLTAAGEFSWQFTEKNIFQENLLSGLIRGINSPAYSLKQHILLRQ